MKPLYLCGIGLLGPGLNGWAMGQRILLEPAFFDATAQPVAVPVALSPNERRRTSETVKWALVAAEEACRQASADVSQIPTVFASSDGDGAILDRLCAALNTAERSVSPTVFHHSVHNAPAGYWHIGRSCQQASSSLSCYDDSFCAGLLEAWALVVSENTPVLLVAYDIPSPPSLYPARPIPHPLAVAFLLFNSPAQRSLAQLDLELCSGPAPSPTPMSNPELERLRREIPAGRALPLLDAVATQRPGTVYLDFLNSLHLRIDVIPCSH